MFIDYVAVMLPLFLISLFCKMISNGVIVLETFFLHKRKVRVGRLLPGVFVLSFVDLLFLFSVGFFFERGSALNEIVYCLLIFPTPFFLLLYYLVYRYIFEAPISITVLSLEWLLMAQYLTILLCAFFANLWAGVLGNHLFIDGYYIPDMPAMLCASAVVILTYRLLRKGLSKSQNFLRVPVSYVPDKVAKKVFNIFMSTMGSYGLLVCIRLLFLREHFDGFSFLSALIYTLLILYQSYRIFDQHYKNISMIAKWQEEETELYIQSLLKAAAEFRQVKHDFYNILQVYGGYISTLDMEGLSKYHQALFEVTVNSGDKLDVVEALQDRRPIYTLINIKRQAAQESNVQMDIKQIHALVAVEMNDLDLCRVLSNLIDNAVHAASESEAKQVSISSDLKAHRAIVEICNSTKGNVDIKELFTPGYTTKNGHSGQGMCSVKNIIDSNKNCSMNVEYHNKHFMVCLSLEAQ